VTAGERYPVGIAAEIRRGGSGGSGVRMTTSSRAARATMSGITEIPTPADTKPSSAA
jgi:hypothetical protein